MAVTWHWEDPGTIAHARHEGEPATLCGAEADPVALMRPVLPRMRCPACETARGTELEVYPNKYIPLVYDDGKDYPKIIYDPNDMI